MFATGLGMHQIVEFTILINNYYYYKNLVVFTCEIKAL